MGLIGNGVSFAQSHPDAPVAPFYGDALAAFNAGIARGTAKLQQEAKDAAKAKREGK